MVQNAVEARVPGRPGECLQHAGSAALHSQKSQPGGPKSLLAHSAAPLSTTKLHAGGARPPVSWPGGTVGGDRARMGCGSAKVKFELPMPDTMAKPRSNSRVQTSSDPAPKTLTGSARAWPRLAWYLGETKEINHK